MIEQYESNFMPSIWSIIMILLYNLINKEREKGVSLIKTLLNRIQGLVLFM